MEFSIKKTIASNLFAMGALSLAFMASCDSQAPNTLTEAEVADGWTLLFDGQTMNGWKDYNGTTLTEPWHVVGRYGWVGGTGTSAHVVPATGTVAVLFTQAGADDPVPPEWMREFWRYSA